MHIRLVRDSLYKTNFCNLKSLIGVSSLRKSSGGEYYVCIFETVILFTVPVRACLHYLTKPSDISYMISCG